MKILSSAIVFCCLAVPFIDGCQNPPRNPKNRVAVISEMANAAAKGDFADGVAIGENYLRDNPLDRNVLQQTAILILAQAKNDQNKREPLV